MSKNPKKSEYVFTMRNKSKKVNQDGGLSFGRKKSAERKQKERENSIDKDLFGNDIEENYYMGDRGC